MTVREASCSCGDNRLRCKGDEGSLGTFRFCSYCGATVWYSIENDPERIAVTLGAFADPSFPPPAFSIYEARKHASVAFNETAPIKHGW